MTERGTAVKRWQSAKRQESPSYGQARPGPSLLYGTHLNTTVKAGVPGRIFFGEWFVHLAALGLLSAFAGAAILWSHNFFFGYDLERHGKGDVYKQLRIYVLLTVLTATIFIVMVTNYTASDDY
jgi:hypothetical protein